MNIMIRLVGIFVGILTLAAVAFAAALPLILQANGLHPDYDGPSYKLPGKRALIVTTSHGTLKGRFVTGQNQNSGHETAHEMMRLVAAKS